MVHRQRPLKPSLAAAAIFFRKKSKRSLLPQKGSFVVQTRRNTPECAEIAKVEPMTLPWCFQKFPKHRIPKLFQRSLKNPKESYRIRKIRQREAENATIISCAAIDARRSAPVSACIARCRRSFRRFFLPLQASPVILHSRIDVDLGSGIAGSRLRVPELIHVLKLPLKDGVDVGLAGRGKGAIFIDVSDLIRG